MTGEGAPTFKAELFGADQQVERGMAFAGPVHGTVNFYAAPSGVWAPGAGGDPRRSPSLAHEAFRGRLRELTLGSSRLIAAFAPGFVAEGVRGCR